jgi:Membrane domain of glycerophosphoryl diester phosphodiesterase
MTDAALAMGGPFRIGPIFGRAWSVYIANFVKFTAVALVIALPQLFTARGESGVGNALTFLAIFVVGIILNTVGQAVILYGAFHTMRGRVFALGQAVQRGLSRFFPIIGLAILAGLGITIGMLLFIVPGIMLAVRWSVALPACVVENLGPLAAMRRSAELTRGHRWKIFGLFLLVLVIVIVAATVIALVVGAAAGVMTVVTGSIVGVVVAGLLTLIGDAIYTAYGNIVLVMLYHDLRVARDGVDTDQIAAVFD